MAGLAEVCPHIASIFFWLEITTKIKDGQTVTNKKAYWVPSSIPTNLVPKKLADFDFTSPNTKKKRLSALVCGSDDATTSNPGDSSPAEKRNIVSPPSDDLNVFFSNLNKCNPKAAILRVLPAYLKQFTDNKKILLKPLTINRNQ